MTFKEQILAGIPTDLPPLKPFDKSINHAPKRKEILSTEEKKLAIHNALRYFDAKYHAILASEFAEEGKSKYSIWLYKGGSRCQHRWTRKLYAKKGGRGLGNAISTTQAIKRGFRPESNDRKVSIAPKNMEYAGYTKEYWDKMGFEN